MDLLSLTKCLMDSSLIAPAKITPKNLTPEAYRDANESAEAQRQELLAKRLKEVISLPPAFYRVLRRRWAYRVAGVCALVGLVLLSGGALFAWPLAPVLAFVWLLIAVVFFSRRLFAFWLGQRLKLLLLTTDDLFSDIARFSCPIAPRLIQSAPGKSGGVVSLSALVLLGALSVAWVASYIPGSPLFAALSSFLVGASFFRSSEINGRFSWIALLRLLGWFVFAWLLPALVLGLAWWGAPLLGIFVPTLCLGAFLGKQMRRHESHIDASI